MDKTTIIVSGVALGGLIVLLSAGRKSQENSVISAVTAESIARDQAAPAIIQASGEFSNTRQKLENEARQLALAATNVHDSQLFDFMSKISANDLQMAGQNLSFAGGNLSDYRKNKTAVEGIRSTEKIELAKTASAEKVELKKAAVVETVETKRLDVQQQANLLNYQLQKKKMSNSFINGIIGGITSGLNPAQSFYGGASASGLDTGNYSIGSIGGGGLSLGGGGSFGLSGDSSAAIMSIVNSIIGGSSGSGLSAVGGGVAGGGKKSGGGGFDIGAIISKVAPALLALL